MLIVFFCMLACLFSYIVGIAIGSLSAQSKLEEARKELQLEDSDVFINGKWYSEPEVEAKFNEMQKEIKELKKQNEFLRAAADNAKLERKDESEVFD